jgi:murein tripeptide amidase MpaA
VSPLFFLLLTGPYDGVVAVRAESPTSSEAAYLRAIAKDELSERGRAVDVLVDYGDLAALDVRGIEYRVTEPDVGAAIEAERTRPRTTGVSVREPSTWFNDFRTLAEIDEAIDTIASVHPNRVAAEIIGTSLEGRPIRAVTVSSPLTPDDAPTVVMIFTQHAREWISPMTGMCFIDRLARLYPADPGIAELVDGIRWVFVPVVNPDGYVYSWTDDRLWRKNRRDGHGVDLNRNWSSGWGLEPGSTSDPEHGNYRGTEAFSEPETAAVRAFVETLDNVRVNVDVHSFSQLVLFPLSYPMATIPENHDELRGWATALADVMTGVHGVPYTPLDGIGFYPASGVSMDWAHENVGSVSLTYELRPQDAPEPGVGFMLPPEQIGPVCEEQFVGLMALGEFVLFGDPPPVEPPPPPPPPQPGDGEGEGDDGGDDGGDDVDAGGEAGTGTTGSGFDDSAGRGCACVASAQPGEGGPRSSLWLWLLPGWAYRRRRARVTARSPE